MKHVSIPDLERHQPARRRRVRRVRQRPHGAQGVARPIQSVESQRLHAALPPVQLVDQQRKPHWTDSNNNYIPDCDLQNFTAQDLSASGGDICGVISNQNFGKFMPSATHVRRSIDQGQPRLPLGLQHRTASTRSFHGVSVDVWLQPQLGRHLHRTPTTLAVEPERLRRILHHRAERFAAAERRTATVRLLRHQSGEAGVVVALRGQRQQDR